MSGRWSKEFTNWIGEPNELHPRQLLLQKLHQQLEILPVVLRAEGTPPAPGTVEKVGKFKNTKTHLSTNDRRSGGTGLRIGSGPFLPDPYPVFFRRIRIRKFFAGSGSYPGYVKLHL